MTTRSDAAVVSPDLLPAVQDGTVTVEGPLGRLQYEVVGVVETRLVPGVYLGKSSLPAHFPQFQGELRVALPPDADAPAYAADLQDVTRERGLEATTADALADRQLAAQVRAGTTLTALAGLGLATALLLVVLVGVRARSERRTTDAVLTATGARPRELAAGLALETALPGILGAVLAAALVVPLAPALATMPDLAFPLGPVDVDAVARAAAWAAAGLALAGLLAGGILGALAARGFRASTLREVD